MDSNHRTRKRADLQSAAVGHLATCPIKNLSHLSESNQRPTDYKSVALPAELKWHLIMPAFAQSYGGRSNKELPPILRGGKGKGI